VEQHGRRKQSRVGLGFPRLIKNDYSISRRSGGGIAATATEVGRLTYHAHAVGSLNQMQVTGRAARLLGAAAIQDELLPACPTNFYLFSSLAFRARFRCPRFPDAVCRHPTS